MAAADTVPSPPPLESLVQVLVRDGVNHLTTGLRKLRESPPHILIGTPQALFVVWQENPAVLQLSHLSSVVVDEVDYLIETIPKKDPERSFHKAFIKAKKKILAHPGVTRELLDVIYTQRKDINERRNDESSVTRHRRHSGLLDEHGSPQLVMSSATLRSHLEHYLFSESGWLNKDNLLKVKGTMKTGVVETTGTSDRGGTDGFEASGITHSVLLVSDTGIENVAGAIPSRSNTEQHQPIDAETLFANPTKSGVAEIDEESTAKYSKTVSPFNPNAIEAIATAFALDVPKVALLVLPSSSPIQRAVYDLREMGVDAHSLDLFKVNKGASYLVPGTGAGEDSPTLLVSTLATTRGLDLPELTHVFILGIPGGPKVTGRTVDTYLHIAGRVGRFGRGGKVITVLEKNEDTEAGPATDSSKMGRILDAIGTRAVRFEYFD